MDESKLTSYYQLAGIHGQPYKAWNGVTGRADATTSGFGGYCTHSSAIFLTWHRPYLALFEQVLYSVIQELANTFPNATRAKYVTAAQNFRIPYYDWASQPASGTTSFPSSITLPKVTLMNTDGKPKTIDNPLASFDFHPLSPQKGDIGTEWARYATTVRYPNRATRKSNNNSVSLALSNENAALRSNISLLLLSYKDYMAFSNNRWIQNEIGSYGSLENTHDNIHGLIGGSGGHMGRLAVSAFDPVFWLHHCNIDRLWAIWQALNPNSYVQPGLTPEGNFTAPVNATEDVNTPLKPFWDTSGTSFWSSAGVKETTTFGYAYPETQKWEFATEPEYQTSVRNAVLQIYGSGNAVQDFITNMTMAPMAAAPVARNVASRPKKNASVTVTEVAAPAANPGHNNQKPLIPQDDFIFADCKFIKFASSNELRN
jgi:tyrosinase